MGSKGYSTGAHVVFKLSVHIVFVTKYRRRAARAAGPLFATPPREVKV